MKTSSILLIAAAVAAPTFAMPAGKDGSGTTTPVAPTSRVPSSHGTVVVPTSTPVLSKEIPKTSAAKKDATTSNGPSTPLNNLTSKVESAPIKQTSPPSVTPPATTKATSNSIKTSPSVPKPEASLTTKKSASSPSIGPSKMPQVAKSEATTHAPSASTKASPPASSGHTSTKAPTTSAPPTTATDKDKKATSTPLPSSTKKATTTPLPSSTKKAASTAPTKPSTTSAADSSSSSTAAAGCALKKQTDAQIAAFKADSIDIPSYFVGLMYGLAYLPGC